MLCGYPRMWGAGLSQYPSVTERIRPPDLIAVTIEDPAPEVQPFSSRRSAQAIVIEDHQKEFFPIRVPLLRILRLTRATTGMLRALLPLRTSKCRTQISWGPHTSVLLTPLLQRASVGEALIGQFS
jgi:hypothetical protein